MSVIRNDVCKSQEVNYLVNVNGHVPDQVPVHVNEIVIFGLFWRPLIPAPGDICPPPPPPPGLPQVRPGSGL